MRAIIDRNETGRAYAGFMQLISSGGVPMRRALGHKGVSNEAELLWHEKLRLWVSLQPERQPTRYWCAFGVENPNKTSRLSITCEVNPPKGGIIDRRCAGLFARDGHGSVHMAHSGKIGGGRPGISKAAFLEHWGGDTVPVRFEDGENREYIILGRVDDSSLRRKLAKFVHSVARFKEATMGDSR